MRVDFIAELTYKRTEDGGRQTAAATGIRPYVKFPFSEYKTSGQQTFLDRDRVHPGESVKAEVTMLSPEVFNGMLRVGQDFEFGEGSRVTGTGVVLEIKNPALRHASA